MGQQVPSGAPQRVFNRKERHRITSGFLEFAIQETPAAQR
jgi:hypothetical protein